MKRIAALIMALMLLTSCSNNDKPASSDDNAKDDTPVTGQETEKEPDQPEDPEPENTVITFTAVGDDLIHNTLSFDSKTGTGYDFSHIYKGVKDYISGSDIAFVNQEVPLDGSVSAYPVLGAPKEVAAALSGVGFNVASLANNHMADRGASAIGDTVSALYDAGFKAVVGAYSDKEKASEYTVLDVNGIKIGFLAYTYGLNSGLGGGNEWMVNFIDKDKIQKDVEAIRPMCDFLAVSMHWGVEYKKTPSDSQREYAKFLSSLDVDLIIGHHPHVLEPAQWIDREGKEQTLCIYSLGNFVSGQREEDRLLGGVLKLQLEFSPDGEFIGFKDAQIDGVVTHYETGNKGFALYMLGDYTDELASRHGLHKYNLPISLGYFTDRMAGIKESLKR
ncbi:MAG: CapA family protein [Clostridiaceae bacterium]|nr:CapA family protein [Clostridiaceae bacterium]